MRDLRVTLEIINTLEKADGLPDTVNWDVIKEAIERAIKADGEIEQLRKVATIAWNVVETKGLSDVLLNELAGRLADWETWKEGED